MLLDNQTALVTGASRGIGQAIARALAAEGARLFLVGRSTGDLENTAARCRDDGAGAVAVRSLDLADSTAVEELCEELLDNGGVDVLVNNAGVFVGGTPLEGDPADWERGLRLNVLVPMHLTRRLAPAMAKRERGLIINLGSVAAIEGMQTAGAYATTKHALRGWSLSCYQALRGYGIKVVLINPGFVATDMTAGVEGADRSRMLSPGDVAEAAMLAVRTRPACCPEEITLRVTKPPLG
jgi:short-subunit dehydrogenase